MAWIGAWQDGRAQKTENLSDPVGDPVGFRIFAILLFVHKLSLGEHQNAHNLKKIPQGPHTFIVKEMESGTSIHTISSTLITVVALESLCLYSSVVLADLLSVRQSPTLHPHPPAPD